MSSMLSVVFLVAAAAAESEIDPSPDSPPVPAPEAPPAPAAPPVPAPEAPVAPEAPLAPEAPVAPLAAPAPGPSDAMRDAPSPTDPRFMRLDGFAEAPIWIKTTPNVKFNVVETRFRVVDASGVLTVADVAHRLGDEAVLARRKREITTGVVVGSAGLALAASMLVAHSVEEINADPVAEPVTAITGALGFVVGVGSFGAVLQANERPWDYWTPDELRVKLTAWNLRNFGVPPLTQPAP